MQHTRLNMEYGKFYDLHVHCGPEGIERKYDFLQLDSLSAATDTVEIVAKSHFFSTVPWAYTARRHGNAKINGSIVLNHYQGGINPYAVAASAAVRCDGHQCLKLVWMPTLHAKGHIEMQKVHGQTKDIPAEWTDGVLSPASFDLDLIEPIYLLENETKKKLDSVLDIIAEHNLILATGHVTREEVYYLVERAVIRGVKKIVLTHPLYDATALDCDDIKHLTALPGVYAEQCYGLVLIDNIPIEKITNQISAAGVEKTILTTDLGQKHSPDPHTGMEAYCRALYEAGVSKEDLHTMIYENPKLLLSE